MCDLVVFSEHLSIATLDAKLVFKVDAIVHNASL